MSDSHPDDKPQPPAAKSADRAAQSREAAARLSALLSTPLPAPTPQVPAKSEEALEGAPQESVSEAVPATEAAGGEPLPPAGASEATEAAVVTESATEQPPEASVAEHAVDADGLASAVQPPESVLPHAVDLSKSPPQPPLELAEIASNREPGTSEDAADNRVADRAALLKAIEKELASLPPSPASAPAEDRAEAPTTAANRTETVPSTEEVKQARAPPLPGEAAAPLDPAARLIARVRRLMLISTALTFIAVAAVLSVVGYRVFNAQESVAPPPEQKLVLPKDARIVRAGVANERLVITLDIGGVTEVRTFDVRTLEPTGRLSFEIAP
jgi:hypothetical protein